MDSWGPDKWAFVWNNVDKALWTVFPNAKAVSDYVWGCWNFDPLRYERELKITTPLRQWFRQQIMAEANPRHVPEPPWVQTESIIPPTVSGSCVLPPLPPGAWADLFETTEDILNGAG
jgi:hypothetical protein